MPSLQSSRIPVACDDAWLSKSLLFRTQSYARGWCEGTEIQICWWCTGGYACSSHESVGQSRSSDEFDWCRTTHLESQSKHLILLCTLILCKKLRIIKFERNWWWCCFCRGSHQQRSLKQHEQRYHWPRSWNSVIHCLNMVVSIIQVHPRVKT